MKKNRILRKQLACGGERTPLQAGVIVLWKAVLCNIVRLRHGFYESIHSKISRQVPSLMCGAMSSSGVRGMVSPLYNPKDFCSTPESLIISALAVIPLFITPLRVIIQEFFYYI